jgi:hypothetical protein
MKDLTGKGKPFHSAIDKAAGMLKRKVGTGAEFMKELQGLGGIKQAEIEERKLGELLGLPKMTHEQFMHHLKTRPLPKIKEKVLEHPSEQAVNKAATKLIEEAQRETLLEQGMGRDQINEELEGHVQRIQNNQPGLWNHVLQHSYHKLNNHPPEHGQWTLPGGENYREMLIKAPPSMEQFPGVRAHFRNEPGILASMRLKDRMTPEGQKLLHLEELQSDWHQQGRDRGYKSDFESQEEMIKKRDELYDARTALVKEALAIEKAGGLAPQELIDRIHGMNDELRMVEERKDKARNAVPDAPFKKNWEEMALKRLVHHAAEKGYHGIVVTPGAEQADRYSLAKHIDALHYNPDTHRLIGKKNGRLLIDEVAVPPEKLEAHIGKEAAQKVMAQEPNVNGLRSLLGEDLQVGGEGMKGFYDKKVPNILNAIGKKHGVKTHLHGYHIETHPARTEEQLAAPGIGHFPEPIIHPAQTKAVHHFPITEEMRKDILKNGLPLYKEGGIIHKAQGGNVQIPVDQMRQALMQNKMPAFGDISKVGANEAPDLPVKTYISPEGQQDGQLPVGGIDMNMVTPGMQYMPEEKQQMSPQGQQGQPGQPGQPPAGPSPLSAGPSSPSQPSNILQMTPQGRAMNAMSPPQPIQKATGGQVGGLPMVYKEGGSDDRPMDNESMDNGATTFTIDDIQDYAGGGDVEGYKSKGKVKQTVKNAQRIAYPGIYGDPKEIAALAASRVAPEDPLLKQLFGVTRADMHQQAHGRQGMPHLGMLPGAAANPKGSMATEGVMNPRNEQRLIDVMAEAQKHQGLRHGMEPWYYMDPLFDRMVKLLGLQKATEEYKKMNAMMGMASSSSEVNTEIPRGSLAYWLQNQGRFNEFVKHGGKRSEERPADFGETPGHLAHKTAHALPMQKFLERGEVDMNSPKVPMYIEASGVPATGFQTRTPVGDAHWSRAVGLADTRNPKTIKGQEVVPGASVSTPEMSALGPWWRHKIANKLGLESVPAQALAWGAFSPQTGVTTPIGAPKLELIAKQIGLTAKRLGVSPQTARDLVLSGKERMGLKKGGKVKDNLDTMRLALTKKKAK